MTRIFRVPFLVFLKAWKPQLWVSAGQSKFLPVNSWVHWLPAHVSSKWWMQDLGVFLSSQLAYLCSWFDQTERRHAVKRLCLFGNRCCGWRFWWRCGDFNVLCCKGAVLQPRDKTAVAIPHVGYWTQVSIPWSVCQIEANCWRDSLDLCISDHYSCTGCVWAKDWSLTSLSFCRSLSKATNFWYFCFCA